MRIGAIAGQPAPEKQNVPPFRGGTWQAFYAGGDNCQPANGTRGPGISWLCGMCGRVKPDSCIGVTAYCSLSVVGYDISCGSFNP
jgi:hypothetical protein